MGEEGVGFGGRAVLRKMAEIEPSTRTIQMGFRGRGTMVDSLGKKEERERKK